MSKPNWMEKTGATPAKLAFVGVLAMVLVGVVINLLPESSASSQLVASRDSSAKQFKPIRQHPRKTGESTPTSTNDATISTNKAPTDHPIRAWKKLSMDRILSYDPLAVPAWLVDARNAAPPLDEASRLAAEAEKERREEEFLRLLREQGAKVIVFSGNEKRAAIGNQLVRIGETIGGFRITDITRKGIVLTELEPR